MSMRMSMDKVSSTPAQDALLRAWIWLSFHRKTRFVLAVIFVCFVCQLTNSTMAMAADDDDDTTALNTYLLPLESITDTHGVPLGKYTELPLDYGQGTYIVRTIRGVLFRFGWMTYTVFVYAILSLCNFILSLEWVDWVLSPFILLANTIQGLMASTGIIGLGIFIAALTIAWGLARGKMGAAMLEIAIVAVFVGIVASPLANPSDQIRSWITTSSTYGTEAGSQAVLGTETGAVLSTNPVSGQIVDIAIRNPALMSSFGSILEGDACSEKFDALAKEGKKTETIRKAVLDCNKALKPANETDSFTIFAFLAMASVSTGGLLALVVVFVIFIIKDVLLAGLGLINTVLRAHLAIFPGGGRQAFVNAFLQLLINVVMVGAYIFMLSLYLWMVGKLYTALGGAVMLIGNLIFGLLLLSLAITFWQMKRQGKSLAKRLAKTLSGSPMNRATDLKPSAFSKGASQAASMGKSAVGQQMRNVAMRKALSMGAVAATAAATGGASVAATRVAATGMHMAGHMRNRAGAKSAPSAAIGALSKAPQSSPSNLLAIAPVNPDAMRDKNGSIPMGSNSMPDVEQQAIRELTPGTRKTNETRMLTATANTESPVENDAQANTADGTASTPITTPAEKKNESKTKLPTGQYGNVRVNRDGTTNNVIGGDVISGEVIDTLPQGIKASRSWEAPGNGRTRGQNRRKAYIQDAADRMKKATSSVRTATRGANG